jgi:hypothetical protein
MLAGGAGRRSSDTGRRLLRRRTLCGRFAALGLSSLWQLLQQVIEALGL